MNFKTYDILSSVIPGYVLLIVLLNFQYDKDLVVPYTAIAFVLGFLVNTLGSWLEDFYFFTWGGKPSNNLLKGKQIWKIRVYNFVALKSNLESKTANQTPSEDELFSIAMRVAFSQKDSRLEDFSSSYAFSRTMLTCVILSSFFLIVNHYDSWKVYSIIPAILVFWYRCKQRGYYFSKEVLNIYSAKENI